MDVILNNKIKKVNSQLADIASYSLVNTIINGNFGSTSGWSKNSVTLTVANNEATCTLTATGYKGLNKNGQDITLVDGHKYYFAFDINPKYANVARFGFLNNYIDIPTIANSWNRISAIMKYASANSYPIFYHNTSSGYVVGDTFKFKNLIIIDLDAIFDAEKEPPKGFMDYLVSKFTNKWFDASAQSGTSLKDLRTYRLNPLIGKKLVVTGDSITQGVNNNDVSYITKVATKNDMALTNYAVSGGALVNTTGRFHIGESIDTIISEHPLLDYLILSGGYNDSQLSVANPIGTYSATDYGGSYDTGTILGMLETMLYKAVQAYPISKIGYVLTYVSTFETGWTANRETMKNVLKKWGIPYIDITEMTHLINSVSLNMRARIFTDNVHPNDTGYGMMADAVESWMKRI